MALDNVNNGIKEKQRSAGLEYLLSDFSRIIREKSGPVYKSNTSKAADYYNYVYKNLNADYSLSDVEDFSSAAELDSLLDDEENSSKLGLFISAALNKVIRGGEKVSINIKKPINYLCYKLKEVEAYLDTAGDLVGCYAENSKIHIDKLIWMDKNIIFEAPSEVIPAGMGVLFSNAFVLCHLSLGYVRKNSDIYIKEAGYQLKDDQHYKHAEYILTVDYKLDRKNGNNVFLSEALYSQHPLIFRISGIKKWKKEAEL